MLDRHAASLGEQVRRGPTTQSLARRTALQTIPATVHEAPYILDGLLMNETGRRVREQYADTGGFTDHVFAACSILGYTFVPRIRDLPSKRLYVFERAGVPKQLRPLVGGKVNADLSSPGRTPASRPNSWPTSRRSDGNTSTCGGQVPAHVQREDPYRRISPPPANNPIWSPVNVWSAWSTRSRAASVLEPYNPAYTARWVEKTEDEALHVIVYSRRREFRRRERQPRSVRDRAGRRRQLPRVGDDGRG